MAPTPELCQGTGFYSRLSTPSPRSSTSGFSPDDTGRYLQLGDNNKDPTSTHADDIFDDDDYVFVKSSSLNSSKLSVISSLSQSMLSLHDKLHTTGWDLRQRIVGKWGWVVTLCNFVFFFTSWGFLNCYGLLFVHLQDEFRSSALETGKLRATSWSLFVMGGFFHCIHNNALALVSEVGLGDT